MENKVLSKELIREIDGLIRESAATLEKANALANQHGLCIRQLFEGRHPGFMIEEDENEGSPLDCFGRGLLNALDNAGWRTSSMEC